MDRDRRKFYLALALFVGWVMALGAMSLLSADRPRDRQAALAPR